MKALYCDGKSVSTDDISAILSSVRYFVFYDSQDPAVAVFMGINGIASRRLFKERLFNEIDRALRRCYLIGSKIYP